MHKYIFKEVCACVCMHIECKYTYAHTYMKVIFQPTEESLGYKSGS